MTPQSTQEYIRAVRLLPPVLRQAAMEVPDKVSDNAEEFRLRIGKPASAVLLGGEIDIFPEHSITASDLQMVLEIATRASAHSYADSIKNGFVTAEGGCRLGLCGSAVTEGNQISGMRRLSSICIRIPREKRGCADMVYQRLCKDGFQSTLIVSPPGGGKTTLLRELIRLISNSGTRVALADERSEVAGTFEGQPCFDVGYRTDVMTGAPKSDAIYLLLRAMAPQIIAFDEITALKDVLAAEQSAYCGVKLLATAHGEGLDELSKRTLYRRLLENNIFSRVVFIENFKGERKYTVEELQ